jgi:hypothetical protein
MLASGKNAVGKEDKYNTGLGVSPGKGTGESGVPEAHGTHAKAGRATARQLPLVKAESASVALVAGMACSEPIYGLLARETHALSLAAIQKQLHHLSHSLGRAKNSCMARYSSEQCRSLVVHAAPNLLHAKGCIVLGRSDAVRRRGIVAEFGTKRLVPTVLELAF